MRPHRIQISVFALALILAILAGCAQEHGDLLSEFPEPVITRADLTALDTVSLAWSLDDTVGVDYYKLYVGIYFNFGYGYFDSSALVDSSELTELLYRDTGLAYFDSTMGDTLYKFTYFRVSAMRDGEEGTPGPRKFITKALD